MTVHGDSIYYVGEDPSDRTAGKLIRHAFPDFKPEVLMSVPYGRIAFVGNRPILIGDGCWVGDLRQGDFRRFAHTVPWHRDVPPFLPRASGESALTATFFSNHYGMIATCSGVGRGMECFAFDIDAGLAADGAPFESGSADSAK